MKKILVVDDERVTLRMHQLVLGRAGFSPELFENGDEALRWAMTSAPDLALLDYQVPGKTGLELLTIFRNTPHLAEMPVIIVTGFRELQLMDSLLEAGANDIVQKPFSAQLLVNRIEELVAGAAADPESVGITS